MRVNIETLTFFVIDYSLQNQNVIVYQIDQVEYAQTKTFVPARTITKQDWDLADETLTMMLSEQDLTIEPTSNGLFELFFQNTIDLSGSVALFDSNSASKVTRYVKLDQATGKIFIPRGQSISESFVPYFYLNKPGNISMVLSWPSMEFKI